MKQLLSLLLVIIGLAACSKKHEAEQHALTSFRLLSKSEAAQVITTDQHEGFFDKVQPLEMAIQMGNPIQESKRDSVLEVYKKFLQDDVLEFLNKDADLLKKTMKRALDICAGLNPKLKLPEILLIKAESKNYGPSVFYTRDNAIVIPAPMLAPSEEEKLLRVLVHEIFHIYSRYNRDKRDEIYALLGFRKLPKIELSKFLKERVLYNPDAVDLAYGITLNRGSSDSSFTAIPVIYSKFGRVDFGGFFSHLVFQLYEVQEQGGVWRVTSENIGLQPEESQGFFEQIGRNTQYIIHPEEVAADNFQMLAYTKDAALKESVVVNAEGQKLLDALEKIVMK